MNKRHHFWLFLIYLVFTANGEAGKIPLSLDSAIGIGLQNNPEIKSSAAKIRASEGGFWSAISPPPAELSATNDYVPTGRGLSGWGEQIVGVNQRFEFPTNYLLRGVKSRRETEISRQEFAQANLDVMAKIKSSYFRALALQEQAKIARDNMEIADRFARKAEIRYSVGEGTNLEKLTAKAQYTQALNAVEINKNHLISAFADLSYALGFGKGDKKEFELTDSLRPQALPLSLDSLVDDAVRNNPRLKAEELREAAAAKEKQLAWSSLLPDVNLGVFSKKVRGDGQDYYGASASLSIPLWFMLDQRGKIKEASSNLASAKLDRRATENAVFLAINDAFSEFRNAEKQVALHQKELLPQVEEIYRAALKSYEAGESTYLEFLQAQQTVTSARSGYVEALLEYNLSIVSLEEAIGKKLPQKKGAL
jgi:cobalt-zinc-cadmium resistance protein CzcA